MTRKALWAVALAIFLAGCNDNYSKPTAVAPQASSQNSPSAASGEPKVEVYTSESGAIYRKGNQSYSLKHYEGKNPILIIATPARDNRGYQQFNQEWGQRQADVQKHGLVLVEFFSMQEAAIRGGRTLNVAETNDLWDIYGPSPSSLTTILIDRDGKQVFRDTGAIDLNQVFATLDGAQPAGS